MARTIYDDEYYGAIHSRNIHADKKNKTQASVNMNLRNKHNSHSFKCPGNSRKGKG